MSSAIDMWRGARNIWWRTKWRLRHLAGAKHQTIVPIQWSNPRLCSDPTTSFVSILNSSEQCRLKSILKEVELFSSLSPHFPSKLTDKDWTVLLECNGRKQRLDHIMFLKNKEKLREKDRQKRLERKPLLSIEDRTRDHYIYSKSISAASEGERRQADARTWQAIRCGSPQLAVDCRFLHQLSPRGADLTGLQLQYLVNTVREWRNPWPLHFVNFDESHAKVARIKEKHLLLLRNSALLPLTTADNYTDVHDRSKIVYLSPHAEEEMEMVKEDEMYVLGGIVDRVKEPGIHPEASKVTAEADGIRTMKLPLDRFVKWESGSKYLTLLTVAETLHLVHNNGGDWTAAFQKSLPVRNTRRSAEKNRTSREKHARIREFNHQILDIVNKQLGADEERGKRETAV